MSKARLEAFSDGVFAIVITLLILDIKLPEVPYAQLPGELAEASPRIVAYVLTFLLIGLYWVFHHHGAHRLEKTDGVMVWLNLVFLLFVSFLPFPTTLLGRYPAEWLPVVFYGLNLIAANAMGFVMMLYAHRRGLLAPPYRDTYFRQAWPIYAVVNGVYLVAIALAWVNPLASVMLYGGVVVGVVARTMFEVL